LSFRRDKRGQIRVIEAFFASLLILSTLALIPAHEGTEKTHYSTFQAVGTNALVALDSNGMLSRLIQDSDWNALKNCAQSVLPVSLWFNFTVFDENMTALNDVAVSNGGAVNEEIVAVNYVCASSGGNYAVYVVRLQLAEAN
jgi:hypothetical protein